MISSEQVPLFKAAKYVLESWGLGPIRPPADDAAAETPPAEDSIAAEVKFSSSTIYGSVAGLVSKTQFEKIVQEMIGPDEIVDVTLLKDAVGELINTIAGNYLTEAFGSKIQFELAPPRNIPPEEWNGSRRCSAAVPGLVETSITLQHDGSAIFLSAEYLKPLIE